MKYHSVTPTEVPINKGIAPTASIILKQYDINDMVALYVPILAPSFVQYEALRAKH